MNAIEFQSVVSGGIIKMPARYRHKQFANAKIIVLANNSQSAQKKEVYFTDFGLIMPADYKFNREDANAR